MRPVSYTHLDVYKRQGHDILFEHKMVKLVHADGKVTGAIFETKDGMKQINAKNTLLATGGYAANPCLLYTSRCV